MPVDSSIDFSPALDLFPSFQYPVGTVGKPQQTGKKKKKREGKKKLKKENAHHSSITVVCNLVRLRCRTGLPRGEPISASGFGNINPIPFRWSTGNSSDGSQQFCVLF